MLTNIPSEAEGCQSLCLTKHVQSFARWQFALNFANLEKGLLCGVYCGMCLPFSDDNHLFVRDNSKKCTGNLRQNSVRDKIQEYFFKQKFFLRLNLLRAEFCLRLNLSRTEFCLRLHTAVVFRMQSFNCYNI